MHPFSCFMVGWQFTENCFEIHIGLFFIRVDKRNPGIIRGFLLISAPDTKRSIRQRFKRINMHLNP